ncbi:hypothetical protein QIS74_12732 [Colletotrichum tabaci]|uniref:Uncharacterized protein n=1 Tax=Colletotrichum tabaci TaxID=1209068 RepID=A0AAV9SUE4_9PEZI
MAFSDATSYLPNNSVYHASPQEIDSAKKRANAKAPFSKNPPANIDPESEASEGVSSSFDVSVLGLIDEMEPLKKPSRAEKLQMETSSFDPCLLFSSAENLDSGVVGMRTDDTPSLSNDPFLRRENEQLEKAAFTARPKLMFATEDPRTFNGS